MKKYTKGFTLIELLVVIAIIGILSSVVLGSVNTARAKGENAAIKADLKGITSQAAVFYDNNSQSYVGLCDDQNVTNALNHAIFHGGDTTGTVATRCNAAADEWAVNALLKVAVNGGTDLYWCVDSTGVSKSEPTELSGATVCS